MGISFNIGVILVALLLLGVAHFAYHRTTPAITTRLRVLLVSLRVLAFLLIAFLLLDPRYILHSTRSERAKVIALVDGSASMALPGQGWEAGTAPTRFEEALSAIDAMRAAVQARGGEFSQVYFSGDLLTAADSVRADGQGTDITRSISSLYKQHEGENVAAFFLLSDGVETEEHLVRKVLPPVPVFAVGLGDTVAPEDVRIKEVDYNSIVRAPSRAVIDATLHYSGDSTRRVHLRLIESGRVIFSRDTTLTPAVREVRQEIPVDFPKEGRRTFVLEARVDGYDAEKENNRRDIVIEAEKGGVKVLIVDLVPAWELHFLTDFLRNDDSFDFDLVTSVAGHPALAEGRLKIPGDFVDYLDDYDALVLASITAPFLDDRTSDAIRRFVSSDGKGLLVMPGHSSLFEHTGAWRRLADLLPVRGTPPHRFNLQFTSVRPGAQAGSNPITSQLVPMLSQTDWQQRSPLLGYYTPLVPKTGVQVLLETDAHRSPAFIYQRVGKGRVALVSVGPLWRWKFLADGSTLYDEMISRLLDVLSRGEDTEKFVLFSRKNVYDSGEAPVLTAEIFNEKMQPVTGVPVRIEIAKVENDGDEVPLNIVSMQREGSDNPRFKATLPPLLPGAYRIKGEADLPGRTISSQTMDFTVSDVSVEYQKVAQDRSNLLRIASQTGGAYTTAASVDALVDRVSLESRTMQTTSEVTLRTSMIVFTIILLSLGAEWMIRKRAGMI
jgi:hypothetical protein